MKSAGIVIKALVVLSITVSCEKQIDMPVRDITFPIPDNANLKG
jgi:hypothetical protein